MEAPAIIAIVSLCAAPVFGWVVWVTVGIFNIKKDLALLTQEVSFLRADVQRILSLVAPPAENKINPIRGTGQSPVSPNVW